MTDFNLSFSDLMLIDEFKHSVMSSDKEKLDSILFTNGMDTSKPYEIVTCEHRNLQNKVVNCPRIEGNERLDDEWIKSGAASLDAIIESTKDSDVRRDLRMMSHQVQQDRAWEKSK